MQHGFVKAAAVTPKIKVADCEYNAAQVIQKMEEAIQLGAKILVFPELCITGYTCNDLFEQEIMLIEAKKQLFRITKETIGKDALIFVGLPLEVNGKLYNTAAALCNGEILGLIPKMCLPNYSEFYEARYFEKGNQNVKKVMLDGKEIPFGSKLLFNCRELEGLIVGAEICEDLWVANPPSVEHALAGATVIVNLSASDETIGKEEYRKQLVKSQSARLLCGYVYASAGEGESTQDLVFGAHNLIAENGALLAVSDRFESNILCSEFDIHRLRSERRKMTTFDMEGLKDYEVVSFSLKVTETKLARTFPNMPFVPGNKQDRDHRCEEILSIQAHGLKKRLEHTGLKNVVLGISGGLDSTLALLVTVRAFDLLNIDRRGIVAVTMPCFGTTNRTYQNAVSLIQNLGATFMEVNIEEAVKIHFKDIGHNSNVHDVIYENSQARERTQVIMDLSNKYQGIVVGTGDMSELALGWATYNGDHMSMYGVNVSVPKTLVRHLVNYVAETASEPVLSDVLKDILDTPVSPELLPPKNGEIAQKTEDLVGPYELHDFFLYYVMRFGYEPKKLYRIAELAFADLYEPEAVLKWMKVFYRRFFSQQFKRSCLPDGPKVGTIALSPRGDLRMPSDASVRIWLEQLEQLAP